jgi:hypothetical protein
VGSGLEAAAAPPPAAAPSAAPSGAVVTTAQLPNIPSILPPQVAQQIRAAQQKAALSGQVGMRCSAAH